MKKIILSGIALLAAQPLMAHPGHDAPAATHWLSDASHIAVVALLAALAVAAGGVIVARARRDAAKGRRAQE